MKRPSLLIVAALVFFAAPAAAPVAPPRVALFAAPAAGGEHSAATIDTTGNETTAREEAAGAPLPIPDPSLVRPMKLDYVVAVSFGGQAFTIGMTRTIEPKMLDELPVWRITSEQKSSMGSAFDTFAIDRKTFLPLYYSVTQGPNRIVLRFGETLVNGRITMPEGEMPIEVRLDEPFFGEAAALEVTIPALPLAVSYSTALRSFEWLTQKSRFMRLTVAGKKRITVPAGTFEAFKITLDPLDGESGGGILFVAEKEPRCVVQATFPIPSQLGGGSLTERLAAFEMIGAPR